MADQNPASSPTGASKDSPQESPLKSGSLASRRLPSRAKGGKRTIFLLVGLVVLIAGFFLWRYFSSYESTDDAQVDVHLFPVSSRISGYVIKVNVGDNQFVEKGTVLVEIDPKDYEVAVAQAKANLANAEATAQALNISVPITDVTSSSQLRFAASGVEDAGEAISGAEAQVASAHAQLEAAQAND